jgi:hypothetical protein
MVAASGTNWESMLPGIYLGNQTGRTTATGETLTAN